MMKKDWMRLANPIYLNNKTKGFIYFWVSIPLIIYIWAMIIRLSLALQLQLSDQHMYSIDHKFY